MSNSTKGNNVASKKSLRISPNGLKSDPTTALQSNAGPSYVALFLTNLRLLNLDLLEDWPDISALTFSMKDSQQSQKKRIQGVEWALYKLFTLWDAELVQNKLQPFFPPLEPLQSLNLRSALFRCLEQLKKNGVLGRDTLLRKTMLDECRGNKFEEVLGVFSNAVLKKVLQNGNSHKHVALAQELALESFSYTEEWTVLLTLILAHKTSLNRLLKEKEDARSRYHAFSELLELNRTRITRRQDQLNRAIEEKVLVNISEIEVREVQDRAYANWSGNSEWLQIILFGSMDITDDALLSTHFSQIWEHVESGSIAKVKSKSIMGVLEQLDARIQDQERRLARWEDFRKSFTNVKTNSPSKKSAAASSDFPKIDLGLTRHQELQVGCGKSANTTRPSSASFDEYARLLTNMRTELGRVTEARVIANRSPRKSLVSEQKRSTMSQTATPAELETSKSEEEWASASESEELFSQSLSNEPKIASPVPLSETHVIPENVASEHPLKRQPMPNHQVPSDAVGSKLSLKRPKPIYMEPPELELTQPARRLDAQTHLPHQIQIQSSTDTVGMDQGTESDLYLAEKILNSISAPSPSPKKKSRHTLSLAERTRLSMARTSDFTNPNLRAEFDVQEIPSLAIKPRPATNCTNKISGTDPGMHDDLIARTRKSMAGFEAAQKKAQVERRRSLKDAKKKQRESSYFPKVEEEVAMHDISTNELIEGDPDYESVFKSRPKIATSPAVSPTKIWNDGDE